MNDQLAAFEVQRTALAANFGNYLRELGGLQSLAYFFILFGPQPFEHLGYADLSEDPGRGSTIVAIYFAAAFAQIFQQLGPWRTDVVAGLARDLLLQVFEIPLRFPDLQILLQIVGLQFGQPLGAEGGRRWLGTVV